MERGMTAWPVGYHGNGYDLGRNSLASRAVAMNTTPKHRTPHHLTHVCTSTPRLRSRRENDVMNTSVPNLSLSCIQPNSPGREDFMDTSLVDPLEANPARGIIYRRASADDVYQPPVDRAAAGRRLSFPTLAPRPDDGQTTCQCRAALMEDLPLEGRMRNVQRKVLRLRRRAHELRRTDSELRQKLEEVQRKRDLLKSPIAAPLAIAPPPIPPPRPARGRSASYGIAQTLDFSGVEDGNCTLEVVPRSRRLDMTGKVPGAEIRGLASRREKTDELVGMTARRGKVEELVGMTARRGKVEELVAGRLEEAAQPVAPPLPRPRPRRRRSMPAGLLVNAVLKLGLQVSEC